MDSAEIAATAESYSDRSDVQLAMRRNDIRQSRILGRKAKGEFGAAVGMIARGDVDLHRLGESLGDGEAQPAAAAAVAAPPLDERVEHALFGARL